MTGYYHVQDHSGFLWTVRSYMMWNAVSLKWPSCKKTTLCVKWNPLWIWNIHNFIQDSPSNWTTLSRDDAAIPLFPAGHAWHLDTNTKQMWRATAIQLLLGMLGASRQTWPISSSLERKKERKLSGAMQCNAMFNGGGGGHLDLNLWPKCCPILLWTRPTHIGKNILNTMPFCSQSMYLWY